LLDQLHQLANSAEPQTQLPKIGDNLSATYGVPVSRELVSQIAAFRPNLNADLRNAKAHFAIVTIPGVPTTSSNPPSGARPLNNIVGVCGYLVTTTYYTLDHYVNGTLVSSEFIGSATTGVTPLYCDDGYTK
jgi:hypothetical protein